MRAMLQALVAAGALALAAVPAGATGKLPATLSWTAYDVGSGGYNQAVAIGNALKTRLGVSLRVLPGKNDISRTLPLRDGKVPFSANGIGGTYMAQEGVYEFGARDWGPQPVRLILLNNSDALLTIVAAKDAGITTAADLKGKRIAWVAGAPSLNQNITALLAFADLTWNDVTKVEFGGFGAAMDGIINNQVDAAFSSTTSGKVYQLAASPRGVGYPVFSHADTEGWERVKRIAPFFVPFMGTEGADMSKDIPVEAATYPYPALITYAAQDAGMVHAMTKAMVELYDDYKDGAPGASGWALDRQLYDWVVPYHEGTIRYLQEIGAWKPAYTAHNNRMIERQKVMKHAWEQVQGAGYDDAAFARTWMKARAEALSKAGFDPVLAEW